MFEPFWNFKYTLRFKVDLQIFRYFIYIVVFYAMFKAHMKVYENHTNSIKIVFKLISLNIKNNKYKIVIALATSSLFIFKS